MAEIYFNGGDELKWRRFTFMAEMNLNGGDLVVWRRFLAWPTLAVAYGHSVIRGDYNGAGGSLNRRKSRAGAVRARRD